MLEVSEILQGTGTFHRGIGCEFLPGMLNFSPEISAGIFFYRGYPTGFYFFGDQRKYTRGKQGRSDFSSQHDVLAGLFFLSSVTRLVAEKSSLEKMPARGPGKLLPTHWENLAEKKMLTSRFFSKSVQSCEDVSKLAISVNTGLALHVLCLQHFKKPTTSRFLWGKKT